MKTILITGAKGFIGKNLAIRLVKDEDVLLLEYDMGNNPEELGKFVENADFIFHLAGVNRPKDISEFDSGNSGFTQQLIDEIEKGGRKIPVLMSSSIQAGQENAYGISKKRAEDELFEYSKRNCAPVYVYRLPNVFGKWCRPNYNSAVATFCHNIANGLEIKINDPDAMVNLVYIDDVVNEFVSAMKGSAARDGDYCRVPVTYRSTVGEIADLIRSFKESRNNLSIPDMSDGLKKKLYSTYLSYLPTDQFSYPLKMNTDSRGSFTELLKTGSHGQVSINISKPGITKGNHWHHTKNEKFLVVSGRGVIKFRNINSGEITEYHVSGDKLEVVDIPVGYTHSITNVGDTDMVTVMWANESFDPRIPDTYPLEV